MPKNLSVGDGYAKWAASYDEGSNPLVRLEAECLRNVRATLQPASVLDAATGTGRHAIAYAQRGASVVGLDESPAMLAVAARKRDALGLSNLRFVEAELSARLTLEDAPFDLVVCALALCHVRSLDAVVAALVRALRTGGALIITDLHPDAVAAGLGTLFSSNGVQYSIDTVHHTVDEYVTAIRRAGAVVVETHERALGDAVSTPTGLPPVLAAGTWKDLPFCLAIVARREPEQRARPAGRISCGALAGEFER
jgi:ubiquinone/menaquinone biosynthesis C-methylase UbiE